jgi:hypothetical protein
MSAFYQYVDNHGFGESVSPDPEELFENPYTIQIHESYDIRNDDINEEYTVSREEEDYTKGYLEGYSSITYEGKPSNAQRVIPRTPSASRPAFFPNTYDSSHSLDQVDLEMARNPNQEPSEFARTPERRRSVGVREIPREDLSSNVIARTPEHPELFANTRSKLLNAFLIHHNTPLSSQSNSDAELSDNDAAEAGSGPVLRGTPPSNYLIQEHVENAISKRKIQFKKISYEEIERSLSKYYDKHNKYSNEVDILITFIRGQKHLYNQSGYITQIKLYALTITALAITSLITVITPFIQQYWWKTIFVIAGNAITTILITTLKYMRFESACNTFTLLSNHYEHYEHSLQITSNKLVFIRDESEQTKIVLDKMQEIEFKMRETSELCPIIIPVEVQKTFPVIYQTNIFTLIKKMDIHRKTLILQLKNIKNEIRYILYKWNSEERVSTEFIDNPQIQREKIRLLSLMDQKEKIKKELIEYKDNYSQIDDLFMKEIKYAETNKKWMSWLTCNVQKIQYSSYTNPVIKEHLALILS